MKYLFDENVSQNLVNLMARCGAPGDELQHVIVLNWRNVDDDVWMPRAVASGFCIVTGDRNEKTRRLTVADLKLLGARALFFAPFWDHMTIWEKTKWLVAKWDGIEALARALPTGSCSLVQKSGRLKAL